MISTFHIHWLSHFSGTNAKNIQHVPLASLRLRAGSLLSVIEKIPNIKLTIGEPIPNEADICIVSKPGLPKIEINTQNWLTELKRYKLAGGKIVIDYTDDSLRTKTPRSFFYEECIRLATGYVAASPYLAECLKEYCDTHVDVIEDPIELHFIPPKQDANWRRSLLWFGHSANLPYLSEFLTKFQYQDPYQITVLTNIEGLNLIHKKNGHFPFRKGKFDSLYGVWNMSAMDVAAQTSDIAIIPSDPNDPKKMGVSSNRLLTALAAGLPTAADRMASYLPFKDYFADIRSDALYEMLMDPVNWRDRILEAQNIISRDYSMDSIGQKWISLIFKYMDMRRDGETQLRLR